jgi:hypothetical protein
MRSGRPFRFLGEGLPIFFFAEIGRALPSAVTNRQCANANIALVAFPPEDLQPDVCALGFRGSWERTKHFEIHQFRFSGSIKHAASQCVSQEAVVYPHFYFPDDGDCGCIGVC